MFKQFSTNYLLLLLNGLIATHVIDLAKEHKKLTVLITKELLARGIVLR